MSCYCEARPVTIPRHRVHIYIQAQTGLYFLQVILLAIFEEFLLKIYQFIRHNEIFLRPLNIRTSSSFLSREFTGLQLQFNIYVYVT